MRCSLFVLVLIVFATSSAFADLITWDFTAGGGSVTGFVVFDDADPSFVPNGTINGANAITDAFFTTGVQEWSLSGGDNFGAPIGTSIDLGPVPGDPTGSFVNAIAATDTVLPAADNSLIGLNGPNGTISTAVFPQGQPSTPFFDGTFTLALGVPEPTSIVIWSLLGLALAGFGYYRFRRKN